MPATISGTTGGIGLIGSGTAQNSTSGTALDFTGIPSGVKRITVMFNGVSTNGSSNVQIQVGSGSFSTSGYVSSATNIPSGGTPSGANSTTGLLVTGSMASTVVFSGLFTLSLLSSNTWASSVCLGRSDASTPVVGGGSTPALAGSLDRVRITTVGGTDAFDAGSINILYE